METPPVTRNDCIQAGIGRSLEEWNVVTILLTYQAVDNSDRLDSIDRNVPRKQLAIHCRWFKCKNGAVWRANHCQRQRDKTYMCADIDHASRHATLFDTKGKALILASAPILDIAESESRIQSKRPVAAYSPLHGQPIAE